MHIYIYVFFPPGTKEQFAAALQGSSNSGKSKRSAIVRSPHPVSLNHAFACQKKMFWQCCSLIANRSACDGLKERQWEATTKSRRILLQHSSAPSSHLVFTNGWDTRILCANPVFMEALQKLRKVQSQQGRRFGRLGTQQALRKSHQSNIWELRNGFH